MNQKERNYLPISELFYSIQGEGVTTGVPSYFIRVSNCNFCCGVKNTTLQQIRKLAKEGQTDFSEWLVPENDASWVCDSIPVWISGHKKPFEYLYNKWEQEGVLDDIKGQIVHLIWTGGEPTMKVNQECIVSFLQWFFNLTDCRVYSEIETNGTCYIENKMMHWLSQINCSAKLSNSGHSKEERIVPTALKRIMEHPNYWFKFVISSEEDIQEMFEDFIKPFNIPLQKVICMPGMSRQEEYFERTKFIMEMAKKYKFIGLSRQHIASWDQVTGV